VGYYKDHPDQDPSNPDNYKYTPPHSDSEFDTGESGTNGKRHKEHGHDALDAILAGPE
jgi:hypothetical protein